MVRHVKTNSVLKIKKMGYVTMGHWEKIQVGERYEVKPQQFKRSMTGKVNEVRSESIVFEVEQCEWIDQAMAKKHPLIEVTLFDIKKPIVNSYFFS